MKKIFATLMFISISCLGYVDVFAGYPEVSCSSYGASANGCDQCFDGGAKYTGDIFAPNDYFNAGSADRIYWDHENPTVAVFNILNSNTVWYKSNNMFRYPNSFTWYTSRSGQKYHVFNRNTNQRFLETVPGRGIKLQSVKTDTVNPNQPAFKLTFVSKYRNLLGPGRQGSLTTHKECIFYKPRYCGDGILQTNKGETCDPRDPLKRGWGNGGCNTNTCKPVTTPECKYFSVATTTGVAPKDITVSCLGYKVNTWKIDCGNGQIFTGRGSNSGDQTFNKICKYTKAGNYTPRCYINNTITNNNCRKSVSITAPKVPSIVVDKTDANVSDIDGSIGNDTQTVYKGEAARFKIRVTNNGQEALKNITLVDAVETSCATKAGTFVNLSSRKFTNAKNANVTINIGGSGTHSNSTLEVGEWFEYYCSKANTQSNYTNTVSTRGVGITSGKTVNDSDPTRVLVINKPTPKIHVDKRDDNNDDLDGNVGGNDSQTVKIGGQAVFRITVQNNGTEDLKNVLLRDAVASACASNGVIDLKNKRFTNKSGNNVSISVTGNGNHADNIFQVGEKFTYTCLKTNTSSDYTNVVEVEGTGVNSNTKVTDSDPTEVVVQGNPSIQVIKSDANSSDLDKQQFNDTQTVVKGEEAVFHITVKNNGDEDLKNIYLEDALASSCASNGIVNLANKYFTNRDGVRVTIFPDGSGNHEDNIFQIGEEFTYTCEKSNTQSNYTNIVNVRGTGITTGKEVTDDDPTEVLVVAPVYDLALIKKIKGSKTVFQNGDQVTFTITVENQGNVDATVKQLVDYIPAGLNLSDTNWTETGGKAYYNTAIALKPNETKDIDIRFEVTETSAKTIKNYAEISQDDGDDCDSTTDNDNQNTNGEKDGTLVDDEMRDGCNKTGDEDDHDVAIITTEEPTLDLIKSLAPGQSRQVAEGDRVHYIITVRNTSNVTITNQKVEDHFPAELILDDSNWSLVTGQTRVARYKDVISSLAPKAEVKFDIYFKIASSAKGEVRNLAVVCKDGAEKCEPVTPPTCDDKDEEGNPEGCEPVIVLKPSIKIDKTDANSADKDGSTGNDTQTVDRAIKAVFKIRVTNDGTENLNTIVLTDAIAPNCAGSVTLPNIRVSTWSNWSTGGGNTTDAVLEPGEYFEYTCEKANTQSNYTNTASVTAKGVDSNKAVSATDTTVVRIPGGGGGGGSTYKCTGVSQSGSTITCKGNSSVKSFYLKCGSTVKGPKNFTTKNGKHVAEFECSNNAFQCYAYSQKDAPIEGRTWRTSNACRASSSSTCGNGIVETGEECDLGQPKTQQKWGRCNINTCKLSKGGGSNPKPNCKTTNSCVLTWPGGANTTFGPQGSVIIGHKQSALTKSIEGYPYIHNDSKYDIGFRYMCVKEVNNDPSLTSPYSNKETCISIDGETLFGYERYYMAEERVGSTWSAPKVITQYELNDLMAAGNARPPRFLGNKSGIGTRDFGKGKIVTTVANELPGVISGLNPYAYYFAADLEVKVAKPSISTVGGGTSFVKSTDSGDVAKVTDNKDTNFVGTSASSDNKDALSSNAETVKNTNTVVVDEIKKDTEIIDTPKEVIKTDTVTTASLENYNDLDNVFIYKGADFKISQITDDFTKLSKPRTYIVENGNLVIDQNIVANKNIAFVVRGGDIKIKKHVVRMDGTYITIHKNSKGGNFIAEESAKQLLVKGSLYGDVSDLVDNRYYISDDTAGLSVGTIVSFGSGLFTKPAPLVTQFTKEYITSTKVAR